MKSEELNTLCMIALIVLLVISGVSGFIEKLILLNKIAGTNLNKEISKS